MALLEVKTEWAVYKDCFLQVARYQADNSRAIEIWNNEDGPIARLSLIHISEPTRLGMISYAVFCLKKKKIIRNGSNMHMK